jgi:hypothetical protein
MPFAVHCLLITLSSAASQQCELLTWTPDSVSNVALRGVANRRCQVSVIFRLHPVLPAAVIDSLLCGFLICVHTERLLSRDAHLLEARLKRPVESIHIVEHCILVSVRLILVLGLSSRLRLGLPNVFFLSQYACILKLP